MDWKARGSTACMEKDVAFHQRVQTYSVLQLPYYPTATRHTAATCQTDHSPPLSDKVTSACSHTSVPHTFQTHSA